MNKLGLSCLNSLRFYNFSYNILRKVSTQTTENVRNHENLFLQKNVQKLLYEVTGFNLDKIFRPRLTTTEPPKYDLYTEEELQKSLQDAEKLGRQKLQMPPVLKMKDETPVVLEENPSLAAYDTHPHVFTDVTYGLSDQDRSVVVRQIDGTLRHATPNEKQRVLNIYFPHSCRMYKTPKIFNEENLERCLKEGRHEYILDRACIQFEPDSPDYIRVTQRTYEHLSENFLFDSLSSTRHFGVMVFYLISYKSLDNLLMFMLQSDRFDDAGKVVKLFNLIHPESQSAKNVIEHQITQTESLIKNFIEIEAKDHGPLELCYQAYLERNENNAESKEAV